MVNNKTCFIIKNIFKLDLYKNNIINKHNKNKDNNLNLKSFIRNLIYKLNLGSVNNIKIINNRYSYNVICYFNKWYISSNSIYLQSIISDNNTLTIFSSKLYITIYNLDTNHLNNKKRLIDKIITCFQ